jgi:acetylornithine/succinyldiaminopimelate/putrescine aminotransferase
VSAIPRFSRRSVGSGLLDDRLGALRLASGRVRAVRGTGLIRGVELDGATAAEVVGRALDAGLLVCGAGPSVVRLLPPLNVSEADLARGMDLLEEAISCWSSSRTVVIVTASSTPPPRSGSSARTESLP